MISRYHDFNIDIVLKFKFLSVFLFCFYYYYYYYLLIILRLFFVFHTLFPGMSHINVHPVQLIMTFGQNRVTTNDQLKLCHLLKILMQYFKRGSSDSVNKLLFLSYQICAKHIDVWKVSMFHTHFSQNYISSCLLAYYIQSRVIKVLFQKRKEKSLKVLTANIEKVSWFDFVKTRRNEKLTYTIIKAPKHSYFCQDYPQKNKGKRRETKLKYEQRPKSTLMVTNDQ